MNYFYYCAYDYNISSAHKNLYIYYDNSVWPLYYVFFFFFFRHRRRNGVHEERLQDAQGRHGPQEAGEAEEHAGILYAADFRVERFVIKI